MEQDDNKKTFRRMSKNTKMNDEFQINFDLDEILSEEEMEASNEIEEDRNYKREYERYHSRPEQIKRRSGRNSARRTVKKKTKNEEDIDGKDVHHKDNDPLNNDPKNLSVVTKHYNRREPRLRERKAKKIEAAFEALEEDARRSGSPSANPDSKELRILIVTTKPKDAEQDMFVTASRFVEEGDKKKIPIYPFYCEDGIVTKEKDGSWFAHNADDKKGFRIDPTDTVAIVRGAVRLKKSWLDVISRLEKIGICMVNPRATVELTSDKYHAYLRLQDAGLTQPKTVLVPNQDSLKIALESLDSKFPIIMKTLEGSKGVGVLFVESERSLVSLVQLLENQNENIDLLIQEYIKADFDVRVIVLGDKVIGAMQRQVIEGDFRSNVSQGAEVKEYKLTPLEVEQSLLASKAVNGAWTAVDFIASKNPKKDPPYILEVNHSPGTAGIEKATGENIVGQVIDFYENPKNRHAVALEIGRYERLELKGLGEIVANFDTGNSARAIMHADEWEVKNGKVIWKSFGKTYKHDLIELRKFKQGKWSWTSSKPIERPTIHLDIDFNGQLYKDVEFLLDDRSHKSTKCLINQRFMRRANVMINPAKTFIVSTKHGVQRDGTFKKDAFDLF